MNTLFNTTFETEEASHYESTVRLRPRTYDLQESNVHLKLTIVDAVGFGDQINKDERQVSCHLLGASGLLSDVLTWTAHSPACTTAGVVPTFLLMQELPAAPLALGTGCRGSWARSQREMGEVTRGLSKAMRAVNKLSSARGWELAALAMIGVSGPVSFNYILFKP